MDSNSTEDLADTLRLFRPPPRIFTEMRGGNVWMGGIDALELELEPDFDDSDYDPYNSAQE